MPFSTPQQFGQNAELLAQKFLRKNGYRILEKNYRCSYGEIDIIAQHRHQIVFIEVKARKTDRFGTPEMAVTPVKQKKISRVALSYLQKTHQLEVPARFDVVGISYNQSKPVLQIVENAFELAIDA